MAGWSASTALAMMVAAASASAARPASTVTASAIPREKLRPDQPEVAMPPTPSAGPSRASASARPPDRSAHSPTRNDAPGARYSAMSPPLLTWATRTGCSTMPASTCSATAPATAAMGEMCSRRCGQQASTMRRATGWSGRGGVSPSGVRSNGNSSHSAASRPCSLNPAASCPARTAPGAPSMPMTRRIGPSSMLNRPSGREWAFRARRQAKAASLAWAGAGRWRRIPAARGPAAPPGRHARPSPRRGWPVG